MECEAPGAQAGREQKTSGNQNGAASINSKVPTKTQILTVYVRHLKISKIVSIKTNNASINPKVPTKCEFSQYNCDI